ncbi:MAG: gliding motility-associated C-terminal domain-containing protein [Flavobacteriales bacterium]|nr:gliding motility-associated C-terminal domain-containing protein [Flavobacteriales bacterium]
MRSFPLWVVLCTLVFPAHATHILGGEMYYDHLGGAQYQVTLKLYRDCGPANTNGTGFDPTADIGVFTSTGAYLFSQTFSFPGAVSVPLQLNNPCLIAPPVICVEQASYTGVLNLPSGTGGYILAYQRCCRVPTILNLTTPNAMGLTCTMRVPDPNAVGNNSSPRFTLMPPTAICANYAFTFDQSATDPDGDVLVYELCDPLHGGTQINPLPLPPDPPPYMPVTWAGGYSATNQMTASPGFGINAATGQLTVTPTLIGSFAVAYRVKEYRGGVLLSEVIRDLRIDVVPCQLPVVSAIAPQQTLCTGTTVTFQNQSVNGQTWLWDFGDPNSSADTSALAAPTYTYGDTGSFMVMLVANPGAPCADTAISVFEMHYPINPQFTPPPVLCFDQQPVIVDATGAFTALANVQWDLGANGTTPLVSGDPGVLSFIQPGVHNVTLTVSQFGCTGTASGSIELHPRPQANVTGGGEGCMPFSLSFLDQSTAWTPLTVQWNYGDGSGGSSGQHLYTTTGTFDLVYTAWTTSGCVDTVVQVLPAAVVVHPQPTAGFQVTPPSVNILYPTVQVNDMSSDAITWYYYIDGEVVQQPSFNWDFQGGGQQVIMQVVTSDQLCSDTAYATVLVVDHTFFAPNAFTPNGDGNNDEWRPDVYGATSYVLTVFDRWGGVLFTTTDPKASWSGEGSPQGVYPYLARVTSMGRAVREYIGHVTIVR